MGKHSGHGTQGKGVRQKGLQGKGHGKAGLHGVGGKGHGAAGRKGKGQGKESGHGYMGSRVFPGKESGWWGSVVRQLSHEWSHHFHHRLTRRWG